MSNRGFRGLVSKLHTCKNVPIPPAMRYGIINQEALMESH